MTAEAETEQMERLLLRQHRSERLLATLAPFARVMVVSHVNPDPDALASMFGLKALLAHCQPDKEVVLTVDGMIARAENRVMVESIPIPLVPVETVPITPGTAVVMVDTQPHTGRRASEDARPHVVLDHHETGGSADRRPVPRHPPPHRGHQHDGDRLPARAERRRPAPAGDGAALRDRVGVLGLPPRGRPAR